MKRLDDVALAAELQKQVIVQDIRAIVSGQTVIIPEQLSIGFEDNRCRWSILDVKKIELVRVSPYKYTSHIEPLPQGLMATVEYMVAYSK